MTLDDDLLGSARTAGSRLADAQHRAELAKADYHHAIRRLYYAGGSLREIADTLELSHQRVHQIIESSGGSIDGRKVRKQAAVVDGPIVCTFCGRAKELVSKLIAGPGVYICNDCVALAERAVAVHEPIDSERTHMELADRASKALCSFCGKKAGDVAALVVGPGVRICDGCLHLCDEILATEQQGADAK